MQKVAAPMAVSNHPKSANIGAVNSSIDMPSNIMACLLLAAVFLPIPVNDPQITPPTKLMMSAATMKTEGTPLARPMLSRAEFGLMKERKNPPLAKNPIASTIPVIATKPVAKVCSGAIKSGHIGREVFK